MKEKIVDDITKRTVYVALDGSEFDDKEQCQIYENTAKCILEYKYN